ncbi:MAG: type I pullulanase [Clostridia bacterium]|nr:type I pullulanase [Clostridia bacterium]
MKKMLCALTALMLALSALLCPGAYSAAEGSAQPADGYNQIRFYWNAEGADLENCDMWIWFPGKDGHGYLFEACEYDGVVALDVPQDISEVGFIVRRDCSEPGGSAWGSATKDYDGDRFAKIDGKITEIYLKSGESAQYKSSDGGKTLYQEKKFTLAGITAFDEIQYYIEPAARIEDLKDVRVYDGDREIEVTSLSSLNNQVITGRIGLGEKLDLSKTYTVEIEGYGKRTAVPTRVFDTQAFSDEFTYDGDDLGATIVGDKTVFKLWAPTASKVVLNLYDADIYFFENTWSYNLDSLITKIEMTKGEKGVWTAEAECGHGQFYTYSVTTAEGTKEAVDPYAKAVGMEGDRGMVVDLSRTNPAGFEDDRYYEGINAYNEAVIWEVHVQDFSKKISESEHPGKYLAFTETELKNSSGESVGMDYVKDLGITHIHLQPVYDFATIDEGWEAPQFNWGYDPKNYNVPEGYYAEEIHGEGRNTEFKQMVQGIHNGGMGVIMDVVYNHTYSLDSNLNRCVPYYYYRYNSNGEPSNGSGCGNETASERPMMRKYIVDSVSYWAKEYHVDGFRFDLMALHDIETMQAVERAVHAINPKAILYGEGWTGGTTPLNPNLMANQANIHEITPSEGAIGAVAVFNDATRDGLKGSVFDSLEKGYISGNVNSFNANRVIFGLTGGVRGLGASWGVNDNGIINYMSCHDNNTLWDKLILSNGTDSEDARLKMNRLGATIIMLGKGTPFFLAGEEMLRTKQLDSNSYASGNEINNLDWEALTPGSAQAEMRDFYKQLIALRKENAFLTQADVSCNIIIANAIEVLWSVDGETVALAVINPGTGRINYNFPAGEWSALLMDEKFYAAGEKTLKGNTPVGGRSVMLVVKAS